MKRLIAVTLVSAVVLLPLPRLSGGLGARAEAPAVIGPYYQTYTGRDFDPIVSDDVIRFASGTGGGVWVKSKSPGVAGNSYLEARVDLPAGAQVSAVTFYVRNCEIAAFDRPQVYFGAYSPSGGYFEYYVPSTLAELAGCDTTQTMELPLDPVITVDPAQFRYVLGYTTNSIYTDNAYSSSVEALLVGARVAYELPGLYLPSVQR